MLSSLVVKYGAQKIQLFHHKRLIAAVDGRGGRLANSVAELGMLPLLQLIPAGHHMIIEDRTTKLVVKHKNDHFELHSYWVDGTDLVATSPLLERRPLSPQSVPAATPQVVQQPSVAPVTTPVIQKVVPLTETTAVQALHNIHKDIFLANGQFFATSVPSSLLLPGKSFTDLGNDFCAAHGVSAPYIAGAMASGIASVSLVKAMAEQKMLGFFGAGGLELAEVEKAVLQLKDIDGPYGCNLLHQPQNPTLEEDTVELYLRHGVKRISASAYVNLTPALVRYRIDGIFRDDQGEVICPNAVFAKVSHPAVAEKFMSPPPERMLRYLLKNRKITASEARLAAAVPMAEDITIEGDSGGHTDRRPLHAIFNSIRKLRNELVVKYNYTQTIRLGAAGGIGDPWSMAAAFALGADFVLVGSANQASVEANTSSLVKEMLSMATIVDCAMGAAPDMFEQGSQVQVLSRGSMYAQRSSRLREVYRQYSGLDELPEREKTRLEKLIFGRPIEDVWADTEQYWMEKQPKQLQRALRDPHHKMALLFRWYLGHSSRWARAGEAERKRDFQIWCSPAMGAFNDWVRGSYLENVAARKVVTIAHALLTGALLVQRHQLLTGAGVVSPISFSPKPNLKSPL